MRAPSRRVKRGCTRSTAKWLSRRGRRWRGQLDATWDDGLGRSGGRCGLNGVPGRRRGLSHHLPGGAGGAERKDRGEQGECGGAHAGKESAEPVATRSCDHLPRGIDEIGHADVAARGEERFAFAVVHLGEVVNVELALIAEAPPGAALHSIPGKRAGIDDGGRNLGFHGGGCSHMIMTPLGGVS